MRLPADRIPVWVVCGLWAASLAVAAAGVALQGEQPIDWPFCFVMFVLAYFGLQVAFDIPGFIVMDAGTPALAISAFVLGPGPATVIAGLTVVLMPDATARFRGRDDGMSGPAVAINTFSATAAVLGASLLFKLVPQVDVAQVAAAVVLYLFIEVVASALALIPLALLGGKDGVMQLLELLGPLFTLQGANGIITATVVVVYEHSPWVALLLGLLVAASGALLQAQVFHARTVADDARDRTDELAAHQLEVLHAMMSALDQRDRTLAAHSRAVSALGARVAERLELTVAERQMVEVVGLLHDIGKFALPDRLRGAGTTASLSGAGESVPQLGARIIAPLSGYGPVAAAIAAQAQPFRSSATPDRPAAEPPLAARVIAVADAYISMVSGSVLMRAHDPLTALARLRAQAGQRFDPQVVETFGQMLLEEGLHTADTGAQHERQFEQWDALTDAQGERSPLPLAASAS